MVDENDEVLTSAGGDDIIATVKGASRKRRETNTEDFELSVETTGGKIDNHFWTIWLCVQT